MAVSELHQITLHNGVLMPRLGCNSKTPLEMLENLKWCKSFGDFSELAPVIEFRVISSGFVL